MTTLRQKIRNNIIYGAIALLPVAAIIFIVAKLFGLMKKISEPLDPYLSINTYLGTALLIVLSIFSLLAMCFLVGMVINTKVGVLTFERLDERASTVIPGYEIIMNMLRGMAGDKMSYPPALITLGSPGVSVLGFVMEDEGDPYLTVFVPSSPVMTTGATYIVERSRVNPIEGSSIEAAECFTQWGLGLKKVMGTTPLPKIS